MKKSHISLTCLTDMKEFTHLTETLGMEKMQPILDEFLRIGERLIVLNGGKYRKNIGDAHLGSFSELESALQFAVEFQQYYQESPCLNREPLISVRVAIFQGVVLEKANDVFGTGVNAAARTAGITQPLQVLVNADFKKSMESVWAEEKVNSLFERIGEFDFKGMRKKQEIFMFRWNSYAKTQPQAALAGRVFKCLEQAGMMLCNLKPSDLTPPGLIVWPAVPRKVATAIHRGQIEIIRLLSLLGWRVHLLVADCGGIVVKEGIDPRDFTRGISAHALARGIHKIEIAHLSHYFQPNHPRHKDALASFQKLMTKFTLEKLIAINQKEYAENIKEEIKKDPALDFLRPILTCATVVEVVAEYEETSGQGKVIVISGEDEMEQWQEVIATMDSSSRMGAIFHPIFKEAPRRGNHSHTARQKSEWPIWRTRKQLEDDLKTTNVGKWSFQLLGQLPAFPDSFVKVDRKELSAATWKDDFHLPKGISKTSLLDVVWPILDPSH